MSQPIREAELAEAFNTPCEHCKDLDELYFEAMDEPHKGEDGECEECEAHYYQEWGGTIYATNEKAAINHPQLKKI